MQTDALQPNFELSMCNIFNCNPTGRNGNALSVWVFWGKNKILSPDKTDSLAFCIALSLALCPLALACIFCVVAAVVVLKIRACVWKTKGKKYKNAPPTKGGGRGVVCTDEWGEWRDWRLASVSYRVAMAKIQCNCDSRRSRCASFTTPCPLSLTPLSPPAFHRLPPLLFFLWCVAHTPRSTFSKMHFSRQQQHRPQMLHFVGNGGWLRGELSGRVGGNGRF